MDEIITDILADEQIEKDVKSCVNDLLDKVEKATKKLYRKRPINKNDWQRNSICSPVSGESKRKKLSYSYFLLKEKDSYRMCKNFYLSTLAVSQKMVYNVHDKKDKVTDILQADGRGKHNKHHRVTEEQREEVIAHINSFPVVDSHYCRAKTNKKYLEAGLTIEKMYGLYK